jgi:hypothetical protein
VADRINASFPNYLQKPFHQRIVVDIAEDDRSVYQFFQILLPLTDQSREMLDGLRRVGFRLNTGIDGTGFILLVWSKASGYYFGTIFHAPLFSSHATESSMRRTDVGASQLIIDGKIKLKNDAQIARFTQKGLDFTDQSTLDADAVIFATG